MKVEAGGMQRGGDDNYELNWRHCSDAVKSAFIICKPQTTGPKLEEDNFSSNILYINTMLGSL